MSLTILPGCPDEVREWAEERERVIQGRVEGINDTDWRTALADAVKTWIDGHLDMDLAVPGIISMSADTEAIELALADAITERMTLAEPTVEAPSSDGG